MTPLPPRALVSSLLPWALAALLLAGAGAARADTIELANGRQIDGVILEERDGRVVVLTKQGAKLNLRREEIVSVVGSEGVDPVANRLDVFLQSGAIADALALLETTLAPDAADPPTCPRRLAMASALAAREDRLDEFFQRESGPRARRLSQLLAELASAWEGDGDAPCDLRPADLSVVLRYDVLLARLAYLRRGDAAVALDRLQRIPRAAFVRPDIEADRIRAADLLLELIWHEQHLRHDEAAAAALALLREVDERAWRAAGAVYHLRQGATFRARGDVARALAIYDADLRAFAPHHADVRVRETLDEAERVLSTGSNWSVLIDLLERFGPTAYGDATIDRVRRAHELAGRDALARGDVEGATAHFAALARLRGDGAERLVLLADMERQRATLAVDDHFGHYQLARRYMEEGLLDEAETIFVSIADVPEFAGPVGRQVEYLRDLREIRLHELANEAMVAGRFYDTLDYTTQFVERFPASKLIDKVRRLADTARAEIANERVRRPLEAKVLFENAERAFFLGDYAGALGSLDRVLAEYGDTKWAADAERLKRQTLDAVYARGFEDYIRQRRLERGSFDAFLGGGEARADVPAGVREEIHFIVSTIGSRLPNDAFGTPR